MALFDALIRDVRTKFDLANRARLLVIEILRKVADPAEGGLPGFARRMRAVGLAEIVDSWIAVGGEKRVATIAQLDMAMGYDLARDLGDRVGAPSGDLAPAIEYALPRVVDLLTPQGKAPAVLPIEARNLLTGPIIVEEEAAAGSWLRRAWPYLAIVGFLLVAWLVIRNPGERFPSAWQPGGVREQASVDPSLSLTVTDHVARIAGLVRDQATRARLLDALQGTFGVDGVAGAIAVDPTVDQAPWTARIADVLAQMKLPGLEALFEGGALWLGGDVAAADLARLREALAALLPDVRVGLLDDRAHSLAAAATDRTLAALAALKPGFGGAELTRALNLSVVNFASGSAEIPVSAQSLVQAAAAAIAAAPAGVLIDIVGHTDSMGDAQANLALSQARAESVRSALIAAGAPAAQLRARGVGDAFPIATNDTPDGRFANRRIEYVVAP